MVFSLTTVAFAATTQTETQMIYMGNTSGQLKRTVYNKGLDNEFCIVEFNNANEHVYYDTRNNYVTLNGEKIGVYIEEDSISQEGIRASRPTSIDHDIYVNSAIWGYIKSTWATLNFENTVNQVGLSVIVSVLTGIFTGGVDVTGTVLSAIATGMIAADPDSDHFFVRTYTYGKRNLLNYTSMIKQIYTSDYDPVDDSCVAYTDFS